MNQPKHQGWEWAMQGSAFGLIIAVACAYLLPTGAAAKGVVFVALPILIALFLYARSRARPTQKFSDTPWDN